MKPDTWRLSRCFRCVLLRIWEMFFYSHLRRFHKLLLESALVLVFAQLPTQSRDLSPQCRVDGLCLSQLLSKVVVLATKHGFGSSVHLHSKHVFMGKTSKIVENNLTVTASCSLVKDEGQRYMMLVLGLDWIDHMFRSSKQSQIHTFHVFNAFYLLFSFKFSYLYEFCC